jgi:hypothetical protein
MILYKNIFDMQIKPIVFTITKDEIEDVFSDMNEEGILESKLQLSDNQITEVLSCVECDEFLARDINISIRSSIVEVIGTH